MLSQGSLTPKTPPEIYFLPPTFLTFLTVVFLGLALLINVCNAVLKSLLASRFVEWVSPNLTAAELLVLSLPVSVRLLPLRLILSRELLLSFFDGGLVPLEPDLPEGRFSGLFLLI